MMYRKTQRKLYMYNYMYMYPCYTCLEFHLVVRNTLLVEQAGSRAKFLAICVQHHRLGPFLVMCATCHPP